MNNFLPVMILKEFIVLPNQEVKIELNNEITKKVIKLASKHHNGDLLVVCPKDNLEESPSINDLPLVGVVCNIKSKIDLPNDNTRVVIVGVGRVKVNEYRNLDDDSTLMANVNVLEKQHFDIVEQTAIKRKLIKVLTQYINESHTLSNSVLSSISQINDIDNLTDIVASFIPLPLEKKINYMEEVDALKRANSLIYDISVELEVLDLDQKIEDALRVELEQNQKDFILREKMNYIKKELGEDEASTNNNISLKYIELLNGLKLEQKTYNKFLDEIHKLDNISDMNPEAGVIRNYLDTVLNLPWNNYSKEETNIDKIKNSLDKRHYGLDKAKNRILEYIAAKKRNYKIKSPIICLVGPPGVGKTSFAMNVAASINREFYKISVGGLNDTSELVGNRKTYIGSMMGKVMQAIKKCGTSNPVIVIDELDKMVKNYNGDPASSLLDILDPSQNTQFIDNYVEEPFDLSQVMFILTANDEALIPAALYDRLEIIEVNSYTEFEKINIAKKYLLPNLYSQYKLSNKNIKFNDEVISNIIRLYTKESGVRELNRLLDAIFRKVMLEYDDKEIKKTIKEEDLNKYLGIVKYHYGKEEATLKAGLVNALAYTPMGGLVLKIESCLFDGKGDIETTGSLGDVINESCMVAVSYIRSNKDTFKVNDYYFDNRNIHIHFLEGAMPKDGPSAGVAIVTTILSLLLNKVISDDVAMTGEITLRGDILEVGGIKEKIIGAYMSGVKQIFIPYNNIKNLEDVPKDIKDNMDIIPVKNYIEIFQRLFN